MKKIFTSIIIVASLANTHAQYAPQYPLPGNTAIHRMDARIIDWATHATVQRGFMDILDPSLGMVSSGSVENAIGAADNMVVSLGDGGYATLSFDIPIANGDGPDFVVFENAFADPLDASMAFLELAFVEVSSDGINYVRFPAYSLTQTDSQIVNDNYYDATKIHNLAGKYISNYGTPFDLEDLRDSANLDINHIKFVRIVDVVGILDDELGSKDAAGNLINDPYPTPFPIGGFDLDAVGVLHNTSTISIENIWLANDIKVFPNPCTDYIQIEYSGSGVHTALPVYIYNIDGRIMYETSLQNELVIPTHHYPTGTYYIKIGNFSKMIIKQ